LDRAHEPLGPLLRKRDRELEAGARAHFGDPAYYTSTYATRTDDIAYYREVAAGKSRVLEYGVGNGRIALPIARDGARVTGIDHSPEMLGDLRRVLAREPKEVRARVTAVRGDMRRVKLGRRFPLVIAPFNTVLHLYTREDVEQWLARVRDHLAPGGELVFDASTPSLQDLLRDPTKPYRTAPFEHPTYGHVNYREHFDYDRARQILFVSMFFDPPGAMTPLAHRQFFPRELEALLHYNGFETKKLVGDFRGNPFTGTSDVMIFHARKKSR
jgi:SAM-dependent methyltransferase